MISLPSSHVRALQAHDERHRERHLARCGHHALCDDVATHDAAEDVDENAFHVRIGQDDLERRRHFLFRGAAADVQEIGGLPPYSLIMSIVAMAKPAPFTMQPIVPSSAM